MRQFYLFVVAILVWTAHAAGQSVRELQPGVAHEIYPGESHDYQVLLAAGEYVQVRVEPPDCPLVIALQEAAGKPLFDLNRRSSPRGILQIVANEAHAFRVVVRVQPGQKESVSYRLTLAESRTATEPERERFAAEVEAEEARRLVGEGKAAAMREALTRWQAVLARWQKLGDRLQQGRTQNSIASCWNSLNQPENARQAAEQSLALARAVADRSGEAYALGNVSGSYLRTDLQQALNWGFQAMAVARETDEQEELARLLYTLGLVYRRLGQPTKARDFYLEARQILQALGNQDREMTIVLALANIQGDLGEEEQALALSQTAREHFHARGRQREEADALNNIAVSQKRLNRYEEAVQNYEASLALKRVIGYQQTEALTLRNLALIYRALKRISEARTALQQAMEIERQFGHQRGEMLTLNAVASLESELGNLSAALESNTKALTLAEELRTVLTSPEVRATFLSTTRPFYELQLDLFLRLHASETAPQAKANYLAAAWQTLEQSRARSLWELLRESTDGLRRELAPDIAAKQAQLRQRIEAKETAINQLGSAKDAAETRTRLRRDESLLLAEYDQLEAQIRARAPRFASLTQTEIPSLAQVQQTLLDDKTLLLEYALGPERSWLLAVTRTSLHSFPLPPRSEIEQPARALYQLMATRAKPPIFRTITEAQRWREAQDQQFQQAAQQLSKMVLAPAQELLPNKRLLIVPEGALYYVPFAALSEPVGGSQLSVVSSKGKPNRPPTTGHQPPLIVKHEILMLPSVSTLIALRREGGGRALAPKTLAIFADPVFAQNDERVTTTRAVTRDNAVAGSVALPRLPASRREAEALAALVAEPQKKVALDFAAQRAAVLNEVLSQYRYVHFATHGLLDNGHPELSALALSLVDRQGAALDGYLRTLDVFKLQLNADLVVLSGCQTALGKEVNGEGLLGLTRGFLYAGARRVVASLWQVNDAATAELMQQFYQGMLGEQKLSPAAALRAAQRKLQKDPRWQSPYYWAAFTLQGEW
jgi:CHAT domain-containing protein